MITYQEILEKITQYKDKDGMSYIESIMQICEDLDIHEEDITKILDKSLISKIKEEAIDLNSLKIKRTNNTLYD